MIKCVAIDDEPKALEVIERYCRKIDSVSLLAVFREPVKAIDFMTREKVDLVFLDINMPDIDGMQLLNTLASKPLVIFTTAYSEYAVESYDVNAIDYLLKPIAFERFLQSVNKVVDLQKRILAEDKFILVKSGSQTHRVKLDDIHFLEKDGNYLVIFCRDKKILVRENMTDVFDLIPKERFIRVHKSFVVAIRHISVLEAHQVTVGSVRIPIGSAYREQFKKQMGL